MIFPKLANRVTSCRENNKNRSIALMWRHCYGRDMGKIAYRHLQRYTAKIEPCTKLLKWITYCPCLNEIRSKRCSLFCKYSNKPIYMLLYPDIAATLSLPNYLVYYTDIKWYKSIFSVAKQVREISQQFESKKWDMCESPNIRKLL